MTEAIDNMKKYIEKETGHIPDWVKQQIDNELLFGIPCQCIITEDGLAAFKKIKRDIKYADDIINKWNEDKTIHQYEKLETSSDDLIKQYYPVATTGFKVRCKISDAVIPAFKNKPDWSARFADAFPRW